VSAIAFICGRSPCEKRDLLARIRCRSDLEMAVLVLPEHVPVPHGQSGLVAVQSARKWIVAILRGPW
jgi:hypothetical protein